MSSRVPRAWTDAEDARLRVLVRDARDGLSWSRIAEKMMTGRDGRSCRQRWEHSLRPDLTRGAWTAEELQALTVLRRRLGDDYKSIADALPTRRSSRQVRERLLEGGRPSRAWSNAEDRILANAVVQLGRRWVAVAKLLPARTDAQCLERYTLSVNPMLRRGAWSAGEDKRLLSAVAQLRASGRPFHFGDVARIVETRHRKACRQRFRLLQPEQC